MKVVTRKEFLEYPAGTIYSRTNEAYETGFMDGLYCKVSKYEADWVEQDLIGEISDEQRILQDSYKEFETDLDSFERDGMFDDEDKFIVWNRYDVTKLHDYLNNVLLNNDEI